MIYLKVMIQVFFFLITINIIISNVISEREYDSMRQAKYNEEKLTVEEQVKQQLSAHFAREKRELHEPNQVIKPHKRSHDIIDSTGTFFCVDKVVIKRIEKFDLVLTDYNCMYKQFPIKWTDTTGTGSSAVTVHVSGFLPTGLEPDCMPHNNTKIDRDTCVPYTKYFYVFLIN
jgi:hypothetical protein